MTTVPTRGARRERWRPSRRLRAAAIAGVAAVVLATGADVASNRVIDGRIVSRATCVLGTPQVTASTGTWAPIEAATDGKVGTVHLTASDVHRRGMTVDLHASLHGVTTSGRVGSSRDQIVVPYDGLVHGGGAKLFGGSGGAGGRLTPSSFSGDGQYLLIGVDAGGLGQTITIAATTSVRGQEMTVTPTYLEVMGHTLPVSELQPLLQARNPSLAHQLDPRHTSLGTLPAGVQVGGVTPEPDGLHISATTTHLSAAAIGARACGEQAPR